MIESVLSPTCYSSICFYSTSVLNTEAFRHSKMYFQNNFRKFYHFSEIANFDLYSTSLKLLDREKKSYLLLTFTF